MSDQPTELHQEIQAALEKHNPMASAWILAYEATEISDDGGIGDTTGLVQSASRTTALGLCELTADELRFGDQEDG